MRQSVYITIGLLLLLCVSGCAGKDQKDPPAHKDYVAMAAEQGMTENAPELSEKPSEESTEEPENPFASNSADLLSEEEKEQLQNTAL